MLENINDKETRKRETPNKRAVSVTLFVIAALTVSAFFIGIGETNRNGERVITINPDVTVEWEKIYEPARSHAITLKPGEKRVWTWNQKDIIITQISAGDYKVKFSVPGRVEGTYSRSFIIKKDAAGNAIRDEEGTNS